MKFDRFLILLLVVTGLLVIIAVGVFLSFPRTVEYVMDDSPSGVFTNYLIAIQSSDFQRAFKYVGDGVGKPSFSTFRSFFVAQRSDTSRVSVRIIFEDRFEDEAVLELSLTTSSNDPFDGTYKRSEAVVMKLQDEMWKIFKAPYQFWAYDWLDGTKYK